MGSELGMVILFYDNILHRNPQKEQEHKQHYWEDLVLRGNYLILPNPHLTRVGLRQIHFLMFCRLGQYRLNVNKLTVMKIRRLTCKKCYGILSTVKKKVPA